MTSEYFSLATGSFTQDWSNTGQITADDNWAGVPSIVGYRGDDLTTTTGVDPQTVTGDSSVVDVIANQGNPNTLTSGGVAEFEITNPTVALQGSGTADAPYIALYLDATGRQNVVLSFDARDIDGSSDNAVQPLAVQYRLGGSGTWTNLPAGFVADATTGPSLATQVTPVSVTLPSAVDNQAQLQVRIITTNASGSDEWVGVDTIVVTSDAQGVQPQLVGFAAGSVAVAQLEGDAGTTVFTFTFTVTRTGGTVGSVDFSGTIAAGATDGADYPGGIAPTTFNGTIAAGQNSATVTVEIAGDTEIEPDEAFTLTLDAVANSDATIDTQLGTATQATGTVLDDDGNVIGGIAILDQAPSLQGYQGATPTAAPAPSNAINLVRLGAFTPSGSVPDESNAEVVSFDPDTGRMFILNTNGDRIDIVAIGSDGALTATGTIDLSALPGFGGANSVAVENGIVAVAYANAVGDQPGAVTLFDTAGQFVTTVQAGVLPDMVVFTPDGTRLLVANEAEALSAADNPAGSVSIIDLSAGAAAASVVNTISFGALDGNEALLRQKGIEIFPGQAASADIEPEYIAIASDGTRAYVTLQEVNAVAVIDLTDPAADRPVALLPLGGVDHSLAGNEFDPSDKNGIAITSADVIGLLQPDSIASFQSGGVTYFVTANEGDSRVGDGITDSVRLKDASYVLDPTAYPNAAALKADDELGRLNVLSTLGDTDGDGDIDQIYALGGRGFSIFRQNDDGTITKVYESGGAFEKIIAAQQPAMFNQNQAPGTADTRSDDKGPEPEGVAVATIGSRTYAFIGLERVGGLMVYDVTDPAHARYVKFVPPQSNDFGPEVVKVIDAADSPTGRTLVVTANEVSGTTTVYEVDMTTIPEIQGAGHVSPLAGQTVVIQGVVTALDTNGSRGFYLQDPNGDGDAATSDGIFVFLPSGALPAIGHLVEVAGTVQEYTPSGAAQGSVSTTEISSVSSVTDLGVGPAIMPVQLGGVGGLVPPTEDLVAGSAFYESLEGMLVKVAAPTAVGPTNAYGEIFTVVDNDGDPSNGTAATGQTARGNLLLTPGAPDFGNTDTVGGDFNPERIQIDDDSGVLSGFTSPAVDVGARLTDVTGIVRYDFGNYEIIPTTAYGVAEPSTLTKETGTLTGDATHLLVASYNAENLDPKLEDITKVSGQSAGNVDDDLGTGKFDTIAAQIFATLNAPDIVAMQEVQDSDGAEISAVTSAEVTLQTLVDKINAQAAAAGSSAHYAYVDNPSIGNGTNGGQPGGNIRTAFLYRDDRVELVAGSVKTIAADGSAITTPGDTDQQTNPDNPFYASRLPLVASFTFNGQTVTVVNNHFTSKGGSAALFGSDQPPFDGGEVQRAAQAQAVNSFVDSLLAADAGAKVIVAGDLNEFPFEEPMQVLKGTASITNYDVPGSDPITATADFTPGGTAILSDLQDLLPADQRYDYVYEGNSETLDHIMVSNGLNSGAQFDVVRVNAEFADQTSDHDPLVASFEITAPVFTLQLLHLSDAEESLLSVDTAPILGALIDRFDDQYANTLVLAGGDNYLPGPFMTAGADPSLNAVVGSAALGRPEIAIHNAYGVEASAIGNHEWDLGSAVFQGAIAPSGAWEGAQFPYISANLDFSGDSAIRGLADASLGGTATNGFAGDEASSIKGKIAPSAVVTEGGEKIGIVGATTQVLERISSPTGTEVEGFPKNGQPGDNTEVDDMALLAAQIQPVIDGLIAQGVNKVILVSHLQSLANEKALAPLLTGVDIILAAGSHTRAGDATDVAAAFPGHDATFAEPYPIVTAGADGAPTLIVVTDSEQTYLGRLVVDFDADGRIVLGDLDPVINGAYASTEATLQAAYGTTDSAADIVAGSAIGSEVQTIVDAVDAVIAAKDGTVYGYSDVYLEGDRVFGRAQETNLGDLSADANAYAAQQALGGVPYLVSLKNGGGIRASIGSVSYYGEKGPTLANPEVGKEAGGISQLDVENALRFDNKLMVFDTTPEGLLAILNYGAGLAPGNGGYPQVGGVRFSYDPDLPVGQRVRDVALIDENDNIVARVADDGVILAQAPALIRVVSLNFTANGGDGYPTKANGENFRYLLDDGMLSAPIDESLDFTAPANVPANAVGEQAAFEDYLAARYAAPGTAYDQADTPVELDTRIQNLNFREDTVFSDGATVRLVVRFESEDAGFDSSVGWVNTRTGEAGWLWRSTDSDGAGHLTRGEAGTQTLTVLQSDLDAGAIVYFMAPDGWNANPQLQGGNSAIRYEDGQVRFLDGSAVLARGEWLGTPDAVHVHFSAAGLNAGGADYAASGLAPTLGDHDGQLTAAELAADADGNDLPGTLAWEDLSWTPTAANPTFDGTDVIGDGDYNDLIFRTDVLPGSAVEMTVSFAGEDAGFDSSVGWVNTRTGEAGWLWRDTDTDGTGNLASGEARQQTLTVELSDLDAGTIALFLAPDGWNANPQLHEGDAAIHYDNGQLSFADGSPVLARGEWLGTPGASFIEFSNPALNPGGADYAAGGTAAQLDPAGGSGGLGNHDGQLTASELAAEQAGDADGLAGTLAWEDLAWTPSAANPVFDGTDVIGDGDHNDLILAVGFTGIATQEGGAGANSLAATGAIDQFVYRRPADGGDTITGFTPGTDRLLVYSPNFGGLPNGALAAGNFALNSPADGDDRFVFNTADSTLFFDADGNGAGTAVAVAALTGVTALSAGDIRLFGAGGPTG